MDALIEQKIKNFIDYSKEINDIKDIVSLPLSKIKGITNEIEKILKETLKVSTIEELAKRKIKKKELVDLELRGIKEQRLSNWLFISKMISENRMEDFLGPKKIALMGLNNAGKTAILHVLKNNVNLNIFKKLKPTKGINRESMEYQGLDCVIWDMGGQENYRKQYLANAERNFLNVELLMFVIDVQDKNNFNSAIVYLKDIMDSIEYLKEDPYFLVLIHKVDPDIRENDEIKESIRFLQKKINEVFKNRNFKYEITVSSIYTKLSKSPSLTKEIRSLLSIDEEEKKEASNTALESTIEHILSLTINLCASIEERFANIETSMANMMEWMNYYSQNVTMVSPKRFAKTEEDNKIDEMISIKKAIGNELKSILKMRKLI
ncbi:MAG: ADP-ribosylation factor-like protein [Candidatus Helarchaeota archaeon]